MSAPPDQLTISDGALLDACLAWGDDLGPRFWDALGRSRRDRVRAVRTKSPKSPRPPDALDRLRAEHRAETRPDLGLVHPTWFARALRDETPAVRLAVASGMPPEVRETLQPLLGLPAGEIAADRPPRPEALRAARTFWADRLVGHEPDPDDDPPIVTALTAPDTHDVALLIRALGLAKRALAGGEVPDLRPRDRERLERFRLLVTSAGFGPEDRRLAGRDVANHPGGDRLGLVTIARLLAVVDPFLTRWALQRLPYPVARLIRSLMAKPGLPAETEGFLLGVALSQVPAEGPRADREGPV